MITAAEFFDETSLFPQMIAKHILGNRYKQDIDQIWFMSCCEYRLCKLFSYNPKAQRILKSDAARSFGFMLITQWAFKFLNDPIEFKKRHPIEEI